MATTSSGNINPSSTSKSADFGSGGIPTSCGLMISSSGYLKWTLGMQAAMGYPEACEGCGARLQR